MATTTIRIKKICEWCGKEFEAKRCSTRFCSKACTDHAYKSQKRKELKKDTEIQSKVSSYTDKTEGLKQQEFLSVADAAQLLNVTTRAVYNLIYRGTLKAYRIPQQWTVIRKEDLTAMIEATQQEEWISYTEARAIYQLTHDQIYSYVKYHGLRKKKVGKYTYILRSEIDAILQPPTLK